MPPTAVQVIQLTSEPALTLVTRIGWKPVIPLNEGLRQTIEWYKRNAEWMAGVRCGE